MRNTIDRIATVVLHSSFGLLFFLVPLILTPLNYELFEYNKMMLTYALTTVIVASWMIRMIVRDKIYFKRTILDLPLLLFLFSQVVSTLTSMDMHVSMWGYYSRFNGGLLSTFSYLLLYWAFVSNFSSKNLRMLLTCLFSSAVLVSLYGVAEHFGIDRNLWVQDVQNRVFSTLGQPNWLAAYLAVLIPITIVFGINALTDDNSSRRLRRTGFPPPAFLFYLALSALFTTTLLYTKSRSGIIGFFIALSSLGAILFLQKERYVKKGICATLTVLLFLIFVIGTPFEKLQKFSLSSLGFPRTSQMIENPRPSSGGSSLIEVGITGSDTIRQIVWKGALEIWRNNPYFGTGVETFAQSYYRYRPVEHNMTSEWDFLYNKAHNEYLNYAANSGLFGLGTYLLFIMVALWSFIKSIRSSSSSFFSMSPSSRTTLSITLGWATILLTNFFGFSVVIIQLFFFLFPSFMTIQECKQTRDEDLPKKSLPFRSLAGFLGIILVAGYVLFTLAKIWYGDVLFARGYQLSRSQEYLQAYAYLQSAIAINRNEPFYYDEISYPIAQIASALFDDKKASEASLLSQEAILSSDIALTRSPKNVNFWKTRTRVMYTLSSIDPNRLADAITSLEEAQKLSPTDPKIPYNLGLLYDQKGETGKAIDLLKHTVTLKPDYRDGYIALAYFYEKQKQLPEARETLQFIIDHIATDDAEARKKLGELK